MNNEATPENLSHIIYSPKRLAVLRKYADPNNFTSKKFDLITQLLASDFKAPVSFMVIIGEDNQWFQSCVGLEINEMPIDHTFFAHVLAETETSPLIVMNTLEDNRFSSSSLVTGEPNIRFLAAAPLILEEENIGAICVIDNKPREIITKNQTSRLSSFAELCCEIFKMRFSLNEVSLFEIKHQQQIRRQQLAIKAANVVSWVWNLHTNQVDCDIQMRKIYGIKHNDPLFAAELLDAIDERDANHVKAQFEAAISGGEPYEAEYRIAETGQWLIGQGKVLDWDENGEPLNLAGVNIDITDQKKSEEKTELLLRELNHRVKNTLAMLQSIASQTLKNSKSPADFNQAFSGRIRSIAAAHTLLSDKEWEPVLLSHLLTEQINIYIQNVDKQLVISGDEVTLGPEESLALGMVFHELATNAAKYGALSTPNGLVEINIKLDQSAMPHIVNLSWIEKNGPEVIKPETNGFGSIMIERSLDKIIGSNVKLEFLNKGVEAHITLPVKCQ